MLRRITITLMLASLVAVVAACGAAEVREPGDDEEGGQQGPIDLAVVPKAIGFDFWEQVRVGAQCAVDGAEDVEMQWDGVTEETDVTGQQNLLQNFQTQGVDGLVYAATDAQVLADVSQSALDQGIDVVNIDSGTEPQPEEVPVFATDNVRAAEEGMDYLAEQIGEEGNVAFIPFQPGTSTNDSRAEGFRQGLEKYPDIELVAEQSSESNYNTALQVTEDILTANPELDAIYAANEPSVLGAAEVVRQSGREDEITIVGWDAADEQIDGLRDGAIDGIVAQNPFRMGYDGTNAAIEIVRSGDPVEGGDTGSVLITRDNVDDEEVQAILNPSCEDPPIGTPSE